MSQVPSLFNRPRLDTDSPAPPALAVTGTLDNYEVGAAYSDRLQIENAIGKCTVAVISSDLPSGSLVYVDNLSSEVVVRWPAFSLTATNVLFNGGFEAGNEGWSLSGPWEINNTGDAETGSYSAEFKKGTRGEFKMIGSPVPVDSPTTIVITARVQQGASSAGNAGAGVGLLWYNGAGATVAETSGPKVTSGSGGAWNTASHSGTRPAGAALVAPVITGFRERENKAFWVDNVQWDHEYFAGDGSSLGYSLSIEVTDSAGRVAAWSGTVEAVPDVPFDPVLSLSIYNKLSEWWQFNSAGDFNGTTYRQLAEIHPTSGSDTNNDLALTTADAPVLVPGPRGSDYGYSFADVRAAFVSGTPIELRLSGATQREWCFLGWFYINSKTSPAVQFPVSWWASDSPASFNLGVSISAGGLLQIRTGGDAYVGVNIPATDVPEATWIFLVAWRDASGFIRATMNDGPVYISSSASTGAIVDAPTIFGAVNTGEGFNFNGAMKDIAFIRDGYLTAEERTMLYNAGQGATFPELVLSAGV